MFPPLHVQRKHNNEFSQPVPSVGVLLFCSYLLFLGFRKIWLQLFLGLPFLLSWKHWIKKQKGCFDMSLIKSADTALQNVSPVFCLTVIGCRIFYAGPLNFAFTPLIGIICHIHSEISEKHIWKYAHWASDAFFASIVSLTANSRTSTNKCWMNEEKDEPFCHSCSIFLHVHTLLSLPGSPLECPPENATPFFCHSLFPPLCAAMAAQKWLSQMFQCLSASGGYTVLCVCRQGGTLLWWFWISIIRHAFFFLLLPLLLYLECCCCWIWTLQPLRSGFK